MNILEPEVVTAVDLLQAFYDSELNCSIGWIWDGGIDWKFGDPINGFEREGKATNVREALQELGNAALDLYPNSGFANWVAASVARQMSLTPTPKHNPFEPRPNQKIGHIYIEPDPHPTSGFAPQWTVFTMGDGTLEHDTLLHGRFWRKEMALTFWEALQDKRKGVTPEQWLSYVYEHRER